jgi:hypothetical protein
VAIKLISGSCKYHSKHICDIPPIMSRGDIVGGFVRFVVGEAQDLQCRYSPRTELMKRPLSPGSLKP